MKSRYCYCPMTSRRIGKRLTLWERIKRDFRKASKPRPDVFQICGYNQPMFPGK